MLNEGSYEVWSEFLKTRRHTKENAKISDRLIQSSIDANMSPVSDFERDLQAMYGEYFNNMENGSKKLNLTKTDYDKIMKNMSAPQKRKFLKILNNYGK